MTLVYVICEGQTEATFVNELLISYFSYRNIFLKPILIGKAKQKGGNVRFARLLMSLKPLLSGSHHLYCTTLFDFYGLPSQFPGKRAAMAKRTPRDKAEIICGELVSKLEDEIGEAPIRRFIPYVQMYEFEGLLFSDPANFAIGINKPELQDKLTSIRAQFETPEHINDHRLTAPSKRIKDLFPTNDGYEKPIMGTLAALEIGLEKMRKECLLFDAWLKRLEDLSK